MLLTFVWRSRHAILTGSRVASRGHPRLRTLLMAVVHGAIGTGDPNAGQSSNGILYFPWPSRIVTFSIFVIACAHFVLNAVYFTRLGLPHPTADTELGNVPSGAVADNMYGRAVPARDHVAAPMAVRAVPAAHAA